jgi:S-adenosylmethionine decarboxylase
MKIKKKESLSSKNKPKPAGIHLIVEFWGGKVIESAREIKKILITAAKKSKNVPLSVKIHKFSPKGITGFILLAESHISIHTWPEIKYIAIDIFSCGKKSQPYKGLEYLKNIFRPKKVKVEEIKRG